MHLRAVLTAACVAASLLATSLPAQAVTDEAARVTITRAKAKELAKAGVLTKNDLKGFTAVRNPRTKDADEIAIYDCLGAKIPKYAAENPGFSFEKEVLTIDSSAFVFAKKKDGKSDFKTFRSEQGDACLTEAFRGAFEAEGATVDSVDVERFAVSVRGADVTFGQRFDMSGSFGEIPFQVKGISVNALVGQTVLSVGPTTFDGREPNLKQAKSLAKMLVKRVRNV